MAIRDVWDALRQGQQDAAQIRTQRWDDLGNAIGTAANKAGDAMERAAYNVGAARTESIVASAAAAPAKGIARVGKGISNSLRSARGGMTKFALGAAALGGGMMLLAGLRPNRNAVAETPEPETMSMPQVLPAAATMPQMQPEMALPPMDLPPVNQAMPEQPESFEHRNRIMAERGQAVPGQPEQPAFVAPKSPIAEELMRPKPASLAEAMASKQDGPPALTA